MNTMPILLVEDNEDNTFLVRHALHKAGVTTPLEVVTTGEQAIEYLGGTNGYSAGINFRCHRLSCSI